MTKEEFIERVRTIKDLAEKLHDEANVLHWYMVRNIEEPFWLYASFDTLEGKTRKSLYTARKIFDRLCSYADTFEENHKK